MPLACGCDVERLTPRIRKSDGTFVYPMIDEDGVFTLDFTEDLNAESTFTAQGGNGIVVSGGGVNGHSPRFDLCVDPDSGLSFTSINGRQCLTAPDNEEFEVIAGDGINVVSNGNTPTVSLCVDPNSPLPLEFVNVGNTRCLRANETYWGPSGITVLNGVTVIPGGTNGHSPQFQMAVDPNSPFGFNANGELFLDVAALSATTCADLAGCSLGDLGDVNDEYRNLPLAVGQVLMFEGAPGHQWTNWPMNEVMAFALGVPFQVVPPVPTSGPPVRLLYDPVIGSFGWQAA